MLRRISALCKDWHSFRVYNPHQSHAFYYFVFFDVTAREHLNADRVALDYRLVDAVL
jgi:hypothetical protein